jgi:hypothetical protein
MQRPFEQELGEFQTHVSTATPTEITPALSNDVVGTVCYFNDLSGTELGRQTHTDARSARMYKSGDRVPHFGKLIRMLNALGYSLYLVKKDGIPPAK